MFPKSTNTKIVNRKTGMIEHEGNLKNMRSLCKKLNKYVTPICINGIFYRDYMLVNSYDKKIGDMWNNGGTI